LFARVRVIIAVLLVGVDYNTAGLKQAARRAGWDRLCFTQLLRMKLKELEIYWKEVSQ
jgi:hypothetical protein